MVGKSFYWDNFIVLFAQSWNTCLYYQKVESWNCVPDLTMAGTQFSGNCLTGLEISKPATNWQTVFLLRVVTDYHTAHYIRTITQKLPPISICGVMSTSISEYSLEQKKLEKLLRSKVECSTSTCIEFSDFKIFVNWHHYYHFTYCRVHKVMGSLVE